MTANACEAFARAFSAFFGADWQPQGPGRAKVTLPAPLAEYFGNAHLELVFTGEVGSGDVLFAPGSQIFEKMVAYLAGRGRHAAYAFKPRAWPAPEPAALYGALEALPEHPADRRYWVYDFLLSFVTDERVEQLFCVAFDEAGAPAPEALTWLGDPELAEADDVPSHIHPAQRLAEAEHAARQEAERRAQELERAASERLAETAKRLEAYFREMIEEVPVRPRRGQRFEEALEAASAEQARLEAELARRLADEARRHQLRVTIRPLGYATLQVPGQAWRWRLVVRGVSRELRVWQNLATGALESPRCQRCAQEASHWTTCRHSHLICGACSALCKVCEDVYCAHELQRCAVCELVACAGCLLPCVNGHAVCREHRVACACCGQGVCTACAVMVLDASGHRTWLVPGHPGTGR